MKNIFLCSAMLIAASPFSLQAMLFASPSEAQRMLSSAPLSHAEKCLVLNEIAKRGQTSVRNEISHTKPQQSTALEIESIFHKDEGATNPLVKNIFDTIDTIEKKSGYRPEAEMIANSNRFDSALPNNYLGMTTRYFWLYKNGSRLATVRVKASLYNQQELLEVVDSYKD